MLIGRPVLGVISAFFLPHLSTYKGEGKENGAVGGDRCHFLSPSKFTPIQYQICSTLSYTSVVKQTEWFYKIETPLTLGSSLTILTMC